MGRVCPATLAVTRHISSGPRPRRVTSSVCRFRWHRSCPAHLVANPRRFGTEEKTTRKERPLRLALLAFVIAAIAAFAPGAAGRCGDQGHGRRPEIRNGQLGARHHSAERSRQGRGDRARRHAAREHRRDRRRPARRLGRHHRHGLAVGVARAEPAAPTSPSRPSPRRSAPSWFRPTRRSRRSPTSRARSSALPAARSTRAGS